MEEQQLLKKGNMLEVVLNFKSTRGAANKFVLIHSREYEINDSTFVQFRVDYCNCIQAYAGAATSQRTLIFIKFQKKEDSDKLSYTIMLTSKELSIIDKSFVCNNGLWNLVFETNQHKVMFDATVILDIIPNAQPFLSLYEDKVLTDFELQGEDGSVYVHKAILSYCSPVFKMMLEKSWKESKEGKVEVAGTSKTTLQHFKNYMYLHTLPEVGLEQLLLLASYYMMPDLEQTCLNKLVRCASGKSVCVLLEFACTHKMYKLVIAILECVHNGAFKINEIRDHFKKSTLS